MSWKTVKLSEVCDIISGNSIPPKKKQELFEGVDGVPYVATKDVGLDGSIKYENGIAIPKKHIEKFRISKNGSTLVCGEGGSAGRKIAFSEKDCCFVNKLFSCTPNSKLVPKFLYYYLIGEQFQSQFKAKLHGLIGGVSLKKMKSFEISFPSIAEQKKLVSKFDNAFSMINESTQMNNKNLDGLKKLLIKKRDKLLSPEKYKNVKWQSCKLEDIIISLPKNGKSPPRELQGDEGTRLLTVSSVTGNLFNINKSTFTKANIANNPKYWIDNGDLLITRANTKELVGHVAIVSGVNEPTMYPDLIMKMKVNNKVISTKFTHQYLMTSNVRRYIESNAKGANPSMVKINQKVVKNIPIEFPPTNVQNEIIKKLEKIQSLIQELKHTYLLKQNSFFKLKSALLEKELKVKTA